MEITVAVVHLDFVEVGDDIKLLVFNHFVRLFEKAAHGTTDVAIEEFLQAFVIDLPLRAVNEPDLFGKRSLSLSKGRINNKMNSTNQIIKVILFFGHGERFGNAREVIGFQTAINVDFVLEFRFQLGNFGHITRHVGRFHRKCIVER